MPDTQEDYSSPEHRRRLFSAEEFIREWRAISDLWGQPNAEYRDEPHLLWLESELANDLQASADGGAFNEEDKIRLRMFFEKEARAATDPGVAERIRRIIASL